MPKSFTLEHILIPTDLSLASLDALRYGRLFAERFNAKLTVFYVEPLVAFGLDEPAYITDDPDRAAQLADDVRGYADQALKSFPYDAFAAEGQPVPTIVSEAKRRGADLIIMATHGLAGWRRAILGSVTQGVLHRSDVPVLSLRRADIKRRPEIAVKTIVCPVNFTEVAREALLYASKVAKAFDAELLIVHVVEEQDAVRAASDEATLRSWIDRSLQNKCSYSEILLRGGAAERVLDFAEDQKADLLIIGAQQKAFRNETVIGTTTERLVRFATIPVLSLPRLVAQTKAEALEELLVTAP
jgi:nucleotide-binding universal stress UspA family protein